MARLRTLKPGFFANQALAALPPLARLLYAGLWTIADREGRLLDRPAYIRGQIFPYENAPVERFLGALAERGFIVRYAAGGERIIAIPTFLKHQNPHVREAPSSLPPPPGQPAAQHCAQPGSEHPPRLVPSPADIGLLGSGEWGAGSGERRAAPARVGRSGRRESVRDQLDRVLGTLE